MADYNFGEAYRIRNRRLQELELQLAGLGDLHAPTHLLVERDNLEAELRMIEQANEPRPSKELLEAVDEVARYERMISSLMALSSRVYEVQQAQRAIKTTVARLPWLLLLIIIVVEVLARL